MSATAPVTVVVALLGAAAVGAAARSTRRRGVLEDDGAGRRRVEPEPLPEMAPPERGAASDARPPWADADDVDVW